MLSMAMQEIKKMIKYTLDQTIPVTVDIVMVIEGNLCTHLTIDERIRPITFKKLFKMAHVDYKRKYCQVHIIAESPLAGAVYHFGNYDNKFIYEYGRTEGYA